MSLLGLACEYIRSGDAKLLVYVQVDYWGDSACPNKRATVQFTYFLHMITMMVGGTDTFDNFIRITGSDMVTILLAGMVVKNWMVVMVMMLLAVRVD